METVITVAVILGMIALGAFVIHLLNGQHAERIAAFRYSRLLPGVRDRNTNPTPRPAHGADRTDARSARHDARSARRDHRDGGRGRLRPRGKRVRTRRT
jgi:hypothetical protein